MKVLHTLQHERDFDYNIHSFYDYAPENVEDTDSFDDADCIFMLCHNEHFYLKVSREQLIANGYTPIDDANIFTLNDYPLEFFGTVQEIMGKIEKLPRIIHLEGFPNKQNRTSWDIEGNLPPAVRAIDIPVAASGSVIGLHKNAQFARIVDNRRFYATRQTKSRKGTVTVMRDNLKTEDHKRMLVSLIKSDAVKRINILRASEEDVNMLLGKNAKSPKVVGHGGNKSPEEMRSVLSDSEWTLQCYEYTGIELMGIEGGFCGAHPIYLDTPFFKKVYGQNLGVTYVNPKKIDEEVVSAIEAGSDWDKHKEAFILEFGAEYHMPKFWESVMKIVMG